MKRKDLFLGGFKSVFNFTFQKAEELSEKINEVWEGEKKPTTLKKTTKLRKTAQISSKNGKQPKERLPKKPKTKMFGTLALPPNPSPQFFELCTGCKECVYSCPYVVLFPVTLPEKSQEYPFLDPNAKACKLCEDYPCISACPEGALLPFEKLTKPKFGKAVGIHQNCINSKTEQLTCNSCETSCPIPKTVKFIGNLPIFSQKSCIGCGLCVEVCPSFPKAIQIKTNKIRFHS